MSQKNTSDSKQVYHSRTPENFEPGDSGFESWTTPNSKHFVRSHFPAPDVDDASSWNIRVREKQGKGKDCRLGDLIDEHLQTRVAHTMVCSGNGRSFFEPAVGGVQWDNGAMGTAFWNGLDVETVFQHAGIELGSYGWVTVIGGDQAEPDEVFTRSIPVSKMKDDCILAVEMNGDPLPPEHGYPVRLIVPGWYGNNCVKWVRELRAMDHMVHPSGEQQDDAPPAKWQQKSYRMYPSSVESPQPRKHVSQTHIQDQMASGEVRHPFMFERLPMSRIIEPVDQQVIKEQAADGIDVWGYAWSGEAPVDVVEVSVDGGDTWNRAELVGPDYGASAWRKFRWQWEPEPGSHTLVSRTTDLDERTQPAAIVDSESQEIEIAEDTFPWNQKGYGNNAYKTYAVHVDIRKD